MAEEFFQVIEAFNEAEIQYVVVGGVAVNLHGNIRYTNDLDVVLTLDDYNCQRTVEVLSDLGYEPKNVALDIHDFLDSRLRNDWIEHKNMKALGLQKGKDIHDSMDILFQPGIPIDELFRDSLNVEVRSGTVVRFASAAHLLKMKQGALRNKDIDDIQYLKFKLRHGNEVPDAS